MTSDEEGNAFGYTLLLDTGHVLFDCGLVAPISFMWDEDGELTLDPEEAASVAFRHPSDLLGRDHAVIDLRDLDDGDIESIH